MHKLILVISAVILLQFSAATKAQAACCGETIAAVQSFIAWITATVPAVVIPYVEFRMGTLIMAIKAGSVATTSAQLMAAAQTVSAVDASVQSDYVMRRGEALLEQRRGFIPPPNECQTATLGSYLGAVSTNYTDYANREAQKQLAVGLSTYSTAADANAIVDMHLNNYPGEQDVRAGRVDQNKLNHKLSNADLSFDAFIAGGRFANPASGQAANNSTYSQEQIIAARRFIDNVSNPFKSSALPKHREFTPEGKSYLALQYAESARLSVPQRIWTELMGRMMPVADLGKTANYLWAKINPLKQNGFNKAASVPNAISYDELLELEVGRRYFNPEWYVGMASLNSPEGIQKEQAYMQALELQLLHQLIQQNKLLLAASATISTNTTKMVFSPLLREQLNLVQ